MAVCAILFVPILAILEEKEISDNHRLDGEKTVLRLGNQRSFR